MFSTGEVLDAAKKLQVNLRLTRFSALPHLSSLRDVTMLPVYWVSQTGTIPANLAAEFAAKVYGVEDGIRGGVYAVTGLAGEHHSSHTSPTIMVRGVARNFSVEL